MRALNSLSTSLKHSMHLGQLSHKDTPIRQEKVHPLCEMIYIYVKIRDRLKFRR